MSARRAVLPVLLLVACSRPAPTAAPRSRPPVFHEIFVRSYMDDNGDGVGDLRGLIKQLDTLNDGHEGTGDDLEVDGLWLMPIHPSPSYHGYDVTDYLGVNPHYGTAADFDALIQQAHARGMRVVMDLVLNHSSREHPWFQTALRGGATRNHYLWRDDDPGWTQPWSDHHVWHPTERGFYFGLFWAGMPDLNYAEPRVVEEMTRVARTWLQRGVDGFRVDAARHLFESPDGTLTDLPATHAFFRSFRSALEKEKRDVLLIAESWTNRGGVATYFGKGDEFHLAFDFDLARAMELAVLGQSARTMAEEIEKVRASGVPWSYSATFLSNHDMARLASRLPSLEAVKAAVTLLLTLPGTPFIYYGDEVGMLQGDAPGDEAKRTPMAWNAQGGFSRGTPWHPYSAEREIRNLAVQRLAPGGLFRHHQQLIRLRHAHPAFSDDAVEVLATDEDARFAMLRGRGNNRALVLVNLSPERLPACALSIPGREKPFPVDSLGPYESRIIPRL